MQVSVEATSGLERKMTVQLPSEQVETAVQSRLQELKSTVRINGFRPGKVPFAVVQKRYGSAVRAEVMNDLVQRSFGEAINKESLRPAGMPHIEAQDGDDAATVSYVATFEVYPEFEVTGLETISVRKPAVEIADEDIDRVINNLREQRCNWKEVDRASADNDKVIIDFKGTVDGEEFQGNSAEEIEVTIGKGQMIEDFDAALKGLKAGDDIVAPVKFPDDYGSPDIAGKQAEFSIKCHKVLEPELPELNEEFVKSFGIEAGTEAAMREEIQKSLSRERDMAIYSRIKGQVLEGLVETNPIDLPKALIDREIESLKQQAKQQMAQYGNVGGMPDMPSDLFEADARKRVTLSLVIMEIINKNEIKLDHSRVTAMIQRVAGSYERPEEILSYYQQNPELMRNIEAAVLEEQAVDWVAEQAKVSEESMSFEELMQKSS